MPRISLLAFVLTSVSACSRLPDPPEPQGDPGPPPTDVAVLAIAPDGTRTHLIEPISINRMAGEYRTVGTGSYVLKLNSDATFKYEYYGCFGLYGTCSGTWALGHDGIDLQINAAEDWFTVHRPARLMVLSLQGHYLLVADNYMELFNQIGVDVDVCLHQRPAQFAIEVEQWRRIREGRK
jgi:hypothetical protein